jgi:hypothetical protein
MLATLLAGKYREAMDIYNPFVNLIISYFGDQEDEIAVAALRRDLPNYPEMRRILHEGLDHALSDPAFERRKLARFANRNGNTDEKARAWLTKIRDALFPA